MFMYASNFKHYPSSWVVSEGYSDNMFVGTQVENIANEKPLKTERRIHSFLDY